MLTRQRLVALVLVLFGVLAPMVAAIVVPDPTWIGGLYDGGDGDEVATLVWDHSSAVVPVGIAVLGLLTAFVMVAPAHPAVDHRQRCSLLAGCRLLHALDLAAHHALLHGSADTLGWRSGQGSEVRPLCRTIAHSGHDDHAFGPRCRREMSEVRKVASVSVKWIHRNGDRRGALKRL